MVYIVYVCLSWKNNMKIRPTPTKHAEYNWDRFECFDNSIKEANVYVWENKDRMYGRLIRLFKQYYQPNDLT